jgi:ATP-binding cassette, subfamily B, bacterial
MFQKTRDTLAGAGSFVRERPTMGAAAVKGTRAYASLALYGRLLGQARPYWGHIAGLFALELAAIPLVLLTPLPLKIAVDSVIGGHPLPKFLAVLLRGQTRSPGVVLGAAAALLVATALLSGLVDAGRTYLNTYTGERLVQRFRAQLFRHVQRLSFAYHDSGGTADPTYRIQYDAASIQSIAIDGVIPFISAALTLVSMVYVTARIDGQLALVALAVAPLLFTWSRTYGPRMRRRWREVKHLESSALAVVQEALSAIRVVAAFGQEKREEERYVLRSGESIRARTRLAMTEAGFGLLVGLTTAAGTAAVLVIGVRHVRAGVLTLGSLLLVMAYLSQLYAPLRTISRKVLDLQASLASAERVFTLLDRAPDVVERPQARPLTRAAGALAFRHVSFGYGPERTVLHDISFEVAPGTRVGIGGMTGAGKTTLVSLLTRFYDPDAGAILLDGVDLRDYRLADLRNQFGIVFQDPVLFSASIAENIAYARPGAGDHEVMEAARAAGAHDFITRLPQGYETQVGARGMRLSGGERQRISLARAFLKDAPILILDEPTSAVDLATESEILDAMRTLMTGRTAFVIAHRPTTLAACDVQLQIERGRLVTPRLPAAAEHEGQQATQLPVTAPF